MRAEVVRVGVRAEEARAVAVTAVVVKEEVGKAETQVVAMVMAAERAVGGVAPRERGLSRL